MPNFGIRTDTSGNFAAITSGTEDVIRFGGASGDNSGQLAGFRNKIINGSFDVWQRGTSFASDAIAADRWSFQYVSGTVAKYAYPVGFNVQGRSPQYGVRWNKTSVSSGVSYFSQKIEGIAQFSDSTVTVSFLAGTGGGSKGCTVALHKRYGAAGSAAELASSQNITITNTSTLFMCTFVIPSNAGKTISGGNDCLDLTFTFDTGVHDLYFSSIQLEIGSIATPFESRPICLELVLCQRYYEYGPYGDTSRTGADQVFRMTYSNEIRTVRFAVLKRAYPTVTVYAYGTGLAGHWRDESAGTNIAATQSRISNSGFASFAGGVATDQAAFNWTAESEL